MTGRSGSAYPCPHGLCDGSGFVLGDDDDAARPCACRAQRIATARTRNLQHRIPKKFQSLGWERHPITSIVEHLDPAQRRLVREFCLRPDEHLDAGKGLWFMGPRGTGKTSLAMLVSQHVLRARRAALIYTGAELLNEIRATYDDDSAMSYRQLIERLRTADLLHIEDLAVVEQPKPWVLEQFYTVINDRYQDERSIMFTADVAEPPRLADHVGGRTYSRLMEMCGDPVLMFGDDYRIKKLHESEELPAY